MADSFDPMTTDRPYRKGLSVGEAAHILHEGRGQQWDPAIVDAFLNYLLKEQQDDDYLYLSSQSACQQAATQPCVSEQASPQYALGFTQLPIRINPCTMRCKGVPACRTGFQEWRYRHVKMVARTIGMKTGTGGSSGAQYLAATIKPFFLDLWAIRAHL